MLEARGFRPIFLITLRDFPIFPLPTGQKKPGLAGKRENPSAAGAGVGSALATKAVPVYGKILENQRGVVDLKDDQQEHEE